MIEITIFYSIAQLHHAAAYIWEHNTYVKMWPSPPGTINDLLEYIKSMMVNTAKKNAKALYEQRENNWVGYTGTGGFTIQFSSDYVHGDNVVEIFADILIDPAVGLPDKGFTHLSIAPVDTSVGV